MPGGYFFGVFWKTVILSKSCSCCGGSTIFKGRTLQKSVRRATPNGNGKRNRQKSFPAPSPDALFRPWARFGSILGSLLGPRRASWGRLSADFRDFLGVLWDPCGFSSRTIFNDSLRRFKHAWRPHSVPSLSKFCPKFDQFVAPLWLPIPTRPALQLKGRRSRGAF